MGNMYYDPKEDSRFLAPVIDRDEWRERHLVTGTTIPYRYLHGYFAGTAVKFSLCFPQKDRYENRFYQYLAPFPEPDEELAALDLVGEHDRISFALCCGAYYVETNLGASGSPGAFDREEGSPDERFMLQCSAAAAEFSRKKAAEIYETVTRPYGFVYGGRAGSGGLSVSSCMKETAVWDEVLPVVIAVPGFFSASGKERQ